MSHDLVHKELQLFPLEFKRIVKDLNYNPFLRIKFDVKSFTLNVFGSYEMFDVLPTTYQCQRVYVQD